MAASTIIVQHRDGSPCRRHRVVLGFLSGNTSEAYTNDYGEATIMHTSVGRATIYVSGRNVGTVHAPGRTSVVY